MAQNVFNTIYCPVTGGFVTAKKNGEQNKCTHVKCEIHYELGRHSWGTGQNNPRGYYLHVTPVSRDEHFESFAAFTGAKFLLVECTRKSSNKETLAKVMYEKTVRAAVEQLFKTDNIDMHELPYPPEKALNRGGAVL